MIKTALNRIPGRSKGCCLSFQTHRACTRCRNRDKCVPREEVHTPTGHLVHKYLLGTYNRPGAILGTEETAENPALTNRHRRGAREIKKKNICQYYVKCAYKIAQ